VSAEFERLPPGWTRTRLDRVATVNARIGWRALTASEYEDEGYTFLATPNIKGSDIDFDNVNYISEYRYEESPELKLRVGDVLLAKDGNTLGITNVVTTLLRPTTVNGVNSSHQTEIIRRTLSAIRTGQLTNTRSNTSI
jgi:type I restriction enzyme S subunit